MVIVASCVLAAAFVAIHGYHHNPGGEGETALFGYRYDDDENLVHKRDSGKSTMWIGPRLGRRSKKSEDESGVMTVPEKNGEAIVELLGDTPWAFVALKGTKRRTVNFIPRLGRDSEEEFVEGSSSDSGIVKSTSRSGNQVMRPYAGANNFTPRLGRFAAFFARDHL